MKTAQNLAIPAQMSPTTRKFKDEKESKIRQDFLFEWFQKFHNNHHVLKSIYKFNKSDCLFNERYISQLLHLAIPSEFESVIPMQQDKCFDEMTE